MPRIVKKRFYQRQSTACPYERMKKLDVLVVGTGAVGRQVARQVALMGVREITLMDHDTIEEHNVVPQMWPISAIGKPKVEVLAEELADLCPHTKIIAVHDRWIPKNADRWFDFVFPTVDNIDIRKNLFEFHFEKCGAFMDVRIGGDLYMVLNAVGDPDEKQWYRDTIFDRRDAHNAGCAQPMTNYIAQLSSGTSVNSMARIVSGRGASVPKLIECNTLTDELFTLNDTTKIKEYFSE